ncbi:MAG: proteasome subunit beta [Candidatus Lokiarchaeota archaeon]
MNREELLGSLQSNRTKNQFNFNSMNKNQENKMKTGTTTVALTCKDAVVMGTDKRASMAYFVSSKTAKKLHKIQDHLWMTIAGSVADAQYLVEVLRAETSIYQLEMEKKIRVKSAAQMLANILYKNKMNPYQVGLILGGVTESEGPVVIDIGAYGSLLPEKFVAVGSGQNFSYGVLEAKYKEDLTVNEGKNSISIL